MAAHVVPATDTLAASAIVAHPPDVSPTALVAEAAVSGLPLGVALVLPMDAAFDVLPFSAGLTGAIVSALMIQGAAANGTGPGTRSGIWQRVTTAIAGVSAATWMAPALADTIGAHSVRLACLIHFITGLLGSTIVAYILANPGRIGRIVARLSGFPADKPPVDPLKGA